MASTSSIREHPKWRLVLVLPVTLLLLSLGSTRALAPCALPDLPSCVCYATCSAEGVSWPPPFGDIVEVALSTVDLRTCCFEHGGQAYWQVQRQATIPEDAEALAFENPDIEDDADTNPEAWCTETIAYWGERSTTPYAGGYYTTRHHPSSYVQSANEMRQWYEDEEAIGGLYRGRWIDGTELDYADFEPGVNGPCPGAYQQIYKYDPTDADGDGTDWDNSKSHSQLIDRMTVYRFGAADGPVMRIDVHMVEGNIGFGDGYSRVYNERDYEDIIEFTALGPADEFLDGSNRKIRGWGVNLNSDGTVDYDPDRIETVVQLFFRGYPAPTGSENSDAQHVAQMLTYYQATGGGVTVSSNSPLVMTGGGLPTEQNPWFIPPGPHPVDPVYIDIDLRAQHPTPVKGVTIEWMDGPPFYFEVWWSGVPVNIQKRIVNVPTGGPPIPPGTAIPFAVSLNPSPTDLGYPVRYARICIPNAMLTRPFLITGFHYNFYYADKEDNNGSSPEGDAIPSDVHDGAAPRALWLSAAMPNPFHGTTRLSFGIPGDDLVSVAVFDVNGRRVRTLSTSARTAGTHEIEWDGRDDFGRDTASGVYFARIEWRGEAATRKLVLIR
jgi:hypothetical protein